MPLMLSKLYDALIEAGASDVKAREAAEEAAASRAAFRHDREAARRGQGRAAFAALDAYVRLGRVARCVLARVHRTDCPAHAGAAGRRGEIVMKHPDIEMFKRGWAQERHRSVLL
jgi:hypothetical protein